jgi:BASS family bile acid:Na+ symporter
MKFCESIFNPLVVVFTVSNLASMGLQVNLSRMIKTAGNAKFLGLILAWGWVVGPALGYLITVVIPLAPPYAAVILIGSLAPCAPFLPPLLGKARGDVDFAGAFIPVAAIGTVLFMPLLAPLLVQGLTLSAMALAKPLVLTVLIPLLIGACIKTFAASTADRIFKPVKVLAGLTTLLTTLLCILLYGKRMLDTAGSFALLSMTVFMVVMGLITYRFSFGLDRSQRTVMSLGMGTRNIAAVFAGVLAIPNADPRMVAMVVMYTVWSFILALIVAPFYGKLAGRGPATPEPTAA